MLAGGDRIASHGRHHGGVRQRWSRTDDRIGDVVINALVKLSEMFPCKNWGRMENAY
jgi:hypothetical protein